MWIASGKIDRWNNKLLKTQSNKVEESRFERQP